MGYFLRSINVLNIILFGVFAVSACYLISPLLHMDTGYVVPSAVKGAVRAGQEAPAQSWAPAAPDFTIIAEQNLFNPERKIPVEKPANAAEGKPLPKPEFVLYGTLITDEGGLAYIEDKKSPLSTPGRGKRVSVLRKGDSLSGFVLRSIEPDRVVLSRGDENVAVSLNDPKARSQNLF
ncbi:MAG: hypothetical protein M1510_11295 [Nitrospirae bacterium]|nr:hypothetical protein [Nitrospirota bacterium]MCL5237666.1 hypothetical protein [Nitrospirota bacterium]